MKPVAFPSTKDIDKSTKGSKPSALNLLKCKCPRCRKGDMFEDRNPWHLKNTMKMNKVCPVCGQPFNIEVGFYYGSGHISYLFAVAFSAISFIAWWLLIGFSLEDNRIYYWLATNAVLLIALQPYIMRIARTGWLVFFVHYDKNWEIPPQQPLERINEEQEGNW